MFDSRANKFIPTGWATDLKTVSADLVRKRVLRTGDGSHDYAKELNAQRTLTSCDQRDMDHFWGWNDELLTEEDRNDVTILNKSEN